MHANRFVMCDYRPTDRSGVFQCARCSHKTAYTPHPSHRIYRECNMQPASKKVRMSRCGDFLAAFITLATNETDKCGSCFNWQNMLNAWGVRGCWLNRRMIWGRLQEQAGARGLVLRWWTVPAWIAKAGVNWVRRLPRPD